MTDSAVSAAEIAACSYAVLVLDAVVKCDKEAGHTAFHTAHVEGAILLESGATTRERHDTALVVWSDHGEARS